jgi:hypothetical protein
MLSACVAVLHVKRSPPEVVATTVARSDPDPVGAAPRGDLPRVAREQQDLVVGGVSCEAVCAGGRRHDRRADRLWIIWTGASRRRPRFGAHAERVRRRPRFGAHGERVRRRPRFGAHAERVRPVFHVKRFTLGERSRVGAGGTCHAAGVGGRA